MHHNEKQIEDLLTDDSFIRWIEGRASAGEAAKWESWMEDDPARKGLVGEAENVHASIRFKSEEVSNLDVNEEYSKLYHSIETFERSKDFKTTTAWAHQRQGYFKPVAAVIVFFLAVLAVLHLSYFEPVMQGEVVTSSLTSSTEYSQKKVLTLYEGSVIHLNANSMLTYPSKYAGGELEVWLEGEAYFEIPRKTGQRPRMFTIHTQDGEVKVLGTKFNVSTYRNGTEVVLEEGSVQVELRDTFDQLQAVHIMEPGELSQFVSGEESIRVRKINPEVYTSWTQNKLIFEQTPLVEIAERIEHIHGIRFPIVDPDLQQVRISGSVPNDNIQVLLNALEMMLERSVVRENGTILLKDRFE